MKQNWWKLLVVVVLAVAVVGVVATKNKGTGVENESEEAAQLPKLVDLGANKCMSCKMMTPILEELSREYKGKLEVVFIDVWENRKASEDYGIQSIPTQIFYDAKGKEFFRHTGFYSKDQILAKFKEQGINLRKE